MPLSPAGDPERLDDVRVPSADHPVGEPGAGLELGRGRRVLALKHLEAEGVECPVHGRCEVVVAVGHVDDEHPVVGDGAVHVRDRLERQQVTGWRVRRERVHDEQADAVGRRLPRRGGARRPTPLPPASCRSRRYVNRLGSSATRCPATRWVDLVEGESSAGARTRQGLRSPGPRRRSGPRAARPKPGRCLRSGRTVRSTSQDRRIGRVELLPTMHGRPVHQDRFCLGAEDLRDSEAAVTEHRGRREHERREDQDDGRGERRELAVTPEQQHDPPTSASATPRWMPCRRLGRRAPAAAGRPPGTAPFAAPRHGASGARDASRAAPGRSAQGPPAPRRSGSAAPTRRRRRAARRSRRTGRRAHHPVDMSR